MMRKGQKIPKKPKFPTRLEESMLKRKQQEFICSCYGDVTADDENVSIPGFDTSLEDDFTSSSKMPVEGGMSVPEDAIKDVDPSLDREKNLSQPGGSTGLTRCHRMHIMYKTPEQVLREMDDERDRMTLVAELTDMIEKKIAKKKEALKKKRMKEKKSNKDQPNWYQELSTAQMKSTEMLGTSLMADMEEGGMERTILVIKSLGLKPFPPQQVIWDVITNCYTSPVLFLLYLSLCLAPKERPKDECDEPTYAVRERIVLSCLAHLLIPRTLFDLHFLLPPPEGIIKEDKRAPAHFKLNKRKFHPSPYLQPQPMLVHTQMTEIEDKTDQIIDILTISGYVNVPKIGEYNNETITQQIQHYIDYNQKKYDHFQEVKEQHRLQAKRSYIRMDRTFGGLVEEENTYYRQLSFLPTLFPTFPNETYTFLRYSTSTETPDTSTLTQIQELRDQKFMPMMSLRHCATSWDYYEESGLTGSLISPLAHITVDEQTTPLQVKALEGYFHAYPPANQYHTHRLKSLTTFNPFNSPDFMSYLKRALAYLARRGNPLAALPDAHLLPHIHKWILKRYRFRMTPSYELSLKEKSHFLFEKKSKYKFIPKPRNILCMLNAQNLTWDRRDFVGKLVKRTKKKFYGRIQTNLVNDARQFWQVMCMKYYDNPYFRDVFFSYLPSKQRVIFLL